MASKNANIKIDLLFDGSGMTRGINQIRTHLKSLQKSAESTNRSISSMGSGSRGFNGLIAGANRLNSTVNNNTNQQVRNMNNQYSSAANNMQSSFQRAGSKVSLIIAGIAASLAALSFGNLLKEGVNDAMGVEAAIAAVDKRFGESAEGIIKWAQANSQAFSMSEGDAISYFNSYSRMLGKVTNDAAELETLSKKFLEMTAVIAAGTGRDTSDVYERITSGLRGETEAIEDLGIDLRAAAIEVSSAFDAMAPDGAKWATLNTDMQNQILTMSILTQAYEIYGDTIATNVSRKHAELVSMLKTTRAALGQAFLPAYVTIIPILKSMVAWLQTVIVRIGQFVNALFGQSKAMKELKSQQAKEKDDYLKKSVANAANMAGATSNAADSTSRLSKATEDSGKKAKKAGEEFKKAAKNVQGFDTINKMAAPEAPKSSDSAGLNEIKAPSIGGAGEAGGFLGAIGLDGASNLLDTGESFESLLEQMEKIPEEMQEKADKIMEVYDRITKFLFGDPDVDEDKGLWGAVKRSYEGIQKILFGDKKDPDSVGLIGWIRRVLFGDPKVDESKGLVGVIKRVYDNLQKLIEERGGTILGIITGFLTTFLILTNSGKIATAFGTVITFLGKLKSFASLAGVLSKLGAVFAMLTNPVTLIAVAIGLLIGVFVDLFTTNEEFRNKMLEVWSSVKDSLSNIWENGIKPVLDSIMEMLGNLWNNVLLPIWDAIKDFVEVLFLLFADIMIAAKPVTDFMSNVLLKIFTFVFDIITKIITIFAVVVGVIIQVIIGIFTKWLEFIRYVMGKIKEFFEGGFVETLKAANEKAEKILKGIGNFFIDMANTAINALNGLTDAIFKGLGVVGELLQKMEFDVPDWVPKIGGQSIKLGWEMSGNPLKIPNIPKLAQGGVIPPRQERLFIAGDNRVEDEIIAPESKLKAMAQEVAMMVSGSGGNSETNQLLRQLIEIQRKGQTIQVSGRDIGRSERAESLKNLWRTGSRV